MAATAMRYAASATYGSEAYDLTKLPGFGEPQEEIAAEPTREELIRQRLDQRARERAQARAQEEARLQVFGFPLLAVVGGIVAAILFVTVLMGYIQIAAISGEISGTRSSIAELSERNEALKLQYESAFDMAEVETYAVNILGMTKAANNDNYYSVILADRAELLAEDETAGLRARVIGFLKSIPEYFG